MTTPKTAELKPCWSCGGVARPRNEGEITGGQHTNGPLDIWIECDDCGLTVRVRSRSQHKLVQSWNTRSASGFEDGVRACYKAWQDSDDDVEFMDAVKKLLPPEGGKS